jgi:hypothetical protein
MKQFRCLLLDIEGTIVLDKKYTPVAGSVKDSRAAGKIAPGYRPDFIYKDVTEMLL